MILPERVTFLVVPWNAADWTKRPCLLRDRVPLSFMAFALSEAKVCSPGLPASKTLGLAV